MVVKKKAAKKVATKAKSKKMASDKLKNVSGGGIWGKEIDKFIRLTKQINNISD